MSEPYLRARREPGSFEGQGQRSAGEQNDPLAELARLVGKDDPFRAPPRPAAGTVARFPQLSAPRHPAEHQPASDAGYDAFHEGDHRDFDAELRGSMEPRHPHDDPHGSLHFPPAENAADAFEPALGYPSASGRDEAPSLNADLWAEGALPQEGPTGEYFNGPEPVHAEPKMARRTMVVLAAVVALTGGGLAATYLMKDGSGMHVSGGAPPTIMAADTPAKVPSPDMSNGNADGNTALLEKSGSDKVDNAKVVANNEQPVDLNQLPKAGQSGAGVPGGASSSPFPEPRKVKTVMIRPDGSVVGETSQPVAAPEQSVGMVLPSEAGGPPAATDSIAKASTPKSTVRASTTPTASTIGAKPSPTAAKTVKPTVVANAAPATEDTPAATPGTWSVQLGAPPSEQEAKEMSTRLQKKFAAELGGAKPSIIKADRDGKSIYRVRVSNLAQADAKSLCSKLQSGGGSCFVVRN